MSSREDRENDAREDAGRIALDARDEELTCETCNGDGLVESDDPPSIVCPECDGTGRIDPDWFESEPWEPRC